MKRFPKRIGIVSRKGGKRRFVSNTFFHPGYLAQPLLKISFSKPGHGMEDREKPQNECWCR